MIDENRLLEEINKLPYTNGNYDKENANTGFINGVQTAYKLITNLIKEQPKVNEWIPVTERLPLIGEYVLVTFLGHFDGKPHAKSTAWIDRYGKWRWVTNGEKVKVEVIAWQPLPKPYKEKENE